MGKSDKQSAQNNDGQNGNLSRRDFLRGAGLFVGGTAAGVSSHFLLPSFRDKPSFKVHGARGYIAQLSHEESVCTGCGTCELVCALVHESSVGPSLRRLWLKRDGLGLIHRVITCLQCQFPSCYFACPRRDEAFCIDIRTGARFINAHNCEPNCKKCLEACPFDPHRINYDPGTEKVIKCDLCKDRESGPACVEFCPAKCLEERER